MPPIEVTCSNPDCAKKFQVGSEMAGELVECPECGASVYVLEPDDSLGELELQGAPADNGDKEHIAHPARQQCPNCGAVLGVRDAFCPECGADIRTGAVAAQVERKKANLVPVFIGGGILAALVVLVGLIFLAVHIVAVNRAKEDAAKKRAAAQAAVPMAQPRQAAPAPPPKPAYEIPAAVLSSLADQELKASQTVDGYLDQLRQTLKDVQAAAPGQKAARWADLYQYCKDKGLDAEADQAWFQAARLGSSDPAVNKKLGLTDSYQGVPVTPAEKVFLDGLKPRLRVVNHDPTLKDDVVFIKGLQPAPIPVGKVVELTPPAGALTLAITRPDRTDRPLQEFSLTAEPGVVQTVDIYNPLAAPSVPLNDMKAIYMALQPTPAAGAAAPAAPAQAGLQAKLEHDAEQHVTAASAGDVRVVGSSADPVTVQLTTRQDHLIVTASIPQGNRFEPDGLQLMSGSRMHPLTLALPSDGNSPLRLTAGAYCVVHADLSGGMWGLLGTINGDLAYEFERTALDKRIDEVTFENAEMEAGGKLYGPWQTTMRLSDEVAARQKDVEALAAQERSAAALPMFRDRAALLSESQTPGPVYLNWPRFRRALALALKDATPALVERLDLIGQKQGAGRTGFGGTSVPFNPGAMSTAAMVAMSSRARQATSKPKDTDAAAFQPPQVALDDQSRTYALMRVLPLMSDDDVLAHVRKAWPDLQEQQRVAALMAVEQVGTPAAVTYLSQLAQSATDTNVTAMALLSLGAIGTPEALAQTQVPGVSAQVHAASLVASIVAGDPNAIEQIKGFLSTASPDERAAFLQYLTQFDTPSTLLALSHAVDGYADPKSDSLLAGALARMGGKAATRELSRLMEKTRQIYADQLGKVRPEDALLLVRQVGTAVAGQPKPDANALSVLTKDGSQAAICYLLSSAINSNDPEVLPALCNMGTAASLEAAARLVDKLDLATLADLRKQWLAPKADGSGWDWKPGVDSGAARVFLDKVFTDGSDAKVRIAAAAMLSEAGRPVPVDKLLAFATSAGQPTAAPAPGAPPGFEWPEAEPMLPKDFKFDGAPGLYAIGLALQTKDPSLPGTLQGFLSGKVNGALKGAAMVALGRIGGDDNLQFLRTAATRTQEGSTDPAALGKALEDRLAAMSGLAAAQDASFLPRAMDMLQAAPPSGLAGEMADWWQITLWRGAADCVAGICSQRSPLELTADSGLESMLTDRLKELIDQPGPKRESLSGARQALREAAIRAFGRVADFNDASNSFVLSRLVIDLSQQSAPAPRTSRTRLGAPAFGPAAAQPSSAQPDALRIAVLDAVAHAGARAHDPSDFVDYARTLASSTVLKNAWSASLGRMADQPTSGYFALLAAGLSDMAPTEGTALFEATKASAQAKGQQYGTFLAALIVPPPAAPAETTRVAAAATRPTAPTSEQTRALMTASNASFFPSQARLKAMEEANIRAGMAQTAAREASGIPSGPVGAPAGFATAATAARRAPIGALPEYSRQLPYKLTDWTYKAPQPTDLEQKWAILQRLIEGAGPALPAVLASNDLVTRSDVGPAAAPALVKQDGAARDKVITQLGDLLAPPPATSGQTAQTGARAAGSPKKSAAPSADARRAAVEALRRIGGAKAVDALYTGLVGRQVTQPQTGGPGGPPPGVPSYAMQAVRQASSNADPVLVRIARALGSMGQDRMLRSALSASDREFFVSDAAGVQTAALSGMAYLPAANDPVTMLTNLVRVATTEQLRQAAAEALVTAAQFESQGQ